MNFIHTGEMIRTLRKQAGLTQESLSEKMNVSPQAVSKWENGHCLPETQLLPELSKILDTTIDELLIPVEDRMTRDLKTQKTVLIEPKIIRKGEIILAGVQGLGSNTGALWHDYEALEEERPLYNKVDDSGYELRIEKECLVGSSVKHMKEDETYVYKRLPDVLYAVFEIYPFKGYESQNAAIDKWLMDNKRFYNQFKLEEGHYAIEYYDERFKGNENPDSIVEIWIPVIKL